jgi:hypothetical protein
MVRGHASLRGEVNNKGDGNYITHHGAEYLGTSKLIYTALWKMHKSWTR